MIQTTDSLFLSLDTNFTEIFWTRPGEKEPILRGKWTASSMGPEKICKTISLAAQAKPGSGNVQVFIIDQWVRAYLAQGLGQTPFVLTNQGLESWIDANQPLTNSDFGPSPCKTPSFWSSDLVFGLSGRTRANGEIEEPLKPEELRFISEKIKLSQPKAVCINLLHSATSPKQEIEIRDFFRKEFDEDGPLVFLSHEISAEPNEIPRWQACLSAGFAAPELKSQHLLLIDGLKQVFENSVTASYLASEGARGVLNAPWNESQLLKYGFAFESVLSETLKSQRSGTETSFQRICYLGLDEFRLFDNSGEYERIWQSQSGPIAVTRPRSWELPLQPGQVIAQSFWGIPGFTNESINLDPGPMFLGRGQRPTLLDLLAEVIDMKTIEPFAERLQTKAKSRVDESLLSFSPVDLRSQTRAKEIREELLGQFARSLPSAKDTLFVGELAGAARLAHPGISNDQIQATKSWKVDLMAEFLRGNQ